MAKRSLAVGQILTTQEYGAIAKSLSLPPRQADIVMLLLDGAGDKRIAKELGLTLSTVRTYMSRLFVKLKVQDRNELILAVLRMFRTGCQGLHCPRNQSGSKQVALGDSANVPHQLLVSPLPSKPMTQ